MSRFLGHMDADEFENFIDTFIEHRSGEDDPLPAQTFFEMLAEHHAATEPVDINIALAEAEPVITASPDAPLTIEAIALGSRMVVSWSCTLIRSSRKRPLADHAQPHHHRQPQSGISPQDGQPPSRQHPRSLCRRLCFSPRLCRRRQPFAGRVKAH